MTQLVQYSMFDDDHPKLQTLSEKVDGVEWSYSKRDTLEQCPLRYYFNYLSLEMVEPARMSAEIDRTFTIEKQEQT